MPADPVMRQGAVRYLLGPAGFFTLRWWEWGPPEGAPTVCLHGLTRSGRDFDTLARALAAEGRRVLCPDLPGRGASDWLPDPALYAPPAYVAVLSYLLARLDDPRGVDWVGTSLGGICGMLLAATPGNPLRRLVLNDVGAVVPATAIARIGDYMRGDDPVFADIAAVEAHLRAVHAPFGPLSDMEWRHLAETSCRPLSGAPGFHLHYDPAIAWAFRGEETPAAVDLSAIWARVSLPTLVIRGARSDVLPAEVAAAMAERPGVLLEEVPAVGHAPALMDPAQIGPILRFLAG